MRLPNSLSNSLLNDAPNAGFTLLELMLAMLLIAVPVLATQTLMFRTAASARLADQQAVALRAASNSFTRLFAFHNAGLWPGGVTASGEWLPALQADHLNASLSVGHTTCINRWCSMNEWAAFEQAFLQCGLAGHADSKTCVQLMNSPLYADTGADTGTTVRRSQLQEFRIAIRTKDSLLITVEWPFGTADMDSSSLGAGAANPLGSSSKADWQQISVGNSS